MQKTKFKFLTSILWKHLRLQYYRDINPTKGGMKMKNGFLIFLLFVIYPLTLSAEDSSKEMNAMAFDELPINRTEINEVSRVFWNAQSIQDEVKRSLPNNLKARFTPTYNGGQCDIRAVTKAEGSADICELNDDPDKMGKFVYNINLSCSFGTYQVSVCSPGDNKLMNQLRVINPEKLVSDENPFDLESTM